MLCTSPRWDQTGAREVCTSRLDSERQRSRIANPFYLASELQIPKSWAGWELERIVGETGFSFVDAAVLKLGAMPLAIL